MNEGNGLLRGIAHCTFRFDNILERKNSLDVVVKLSFDSLISQWSEKRFYDDDFSNQHEFSYSLNKYR